MEKNPQGFSGTSFALPYIIFLIFTHAVLGAKYGDVTNEHSFPQGDHRRGSYDDDEEFEGPMKNRGCRDIICLLIFLAYVGFMAYLFFYSVVVGDVNRLTKGYDISGNSCGEKSNDKIDGVPFSGMDTSEKP